MWAASEGYASLQVWVIHFMIYTYSFLELATILSTFSVISILDSFNSWTALQFDHIKVAQNRPA